MNRTVWFCCGTFCSLPPLLHKKYVLVHSDQTFSSPFVSMISFSSPFQRSSFGLSLSCLSLAFSWIAMPSFSHFAQVSYPFLLYSSYQQNVLLPSDPSLTSFHPSLSLSLVSPLPPCLSPEIITTSLVKISLYLNSWISKAWGCWQSLFNSQVKQ